EPYPPPAFHRHGIGTDALLVKPGHIAHERSADQVPIEIVGPLMIGAEYGPAGNHTAVHRHARRRRLVGATEPRAPMTANVVESAQCALPISHENDALADYIQDARISRPRQLLLARHAQPLAAEDALPFQRVDLVAVVPSRR